MQRKETNNGLTKFGTPIFDILISEPRRFSERNKLHYRNVSSDKKLKVFPENCVLPHT
jgi:hypothetical protein